MTAYKDERLLAVAEVAKTIRDAAPGRKTAFAEMIIESIEPNRLALDLFENLFMPTRRLNEGDMLVKRVRDGKFPVRVMVPGTDHLATQARPPREVMTYALEALITKIRHNLIELNRGEIGTIEQFRNDMQLSIAQDIVARVFTLLSTVWNGTDTPNNYAQVSSAINATVLDTMIENVLEQAGNIRAIVGTRRALFPMYQFAGIREHTVDTSTTRIVFYQNPLDEFMNTNRITTYRGMRVIELPQVFERSATNFNKKLIPDNLVLVIGDNAGEVILYGDYQVQEHIDTSVEPADYVLSMWRQYGMIIDYPERIGVIKIV